MTTNMCKVLKCEQEAVQVVPVIGPLCVEHFKTLPNSGTEWILEPGDSLPGGGHAESMILTGEGLRELHEYLLLEVPTQLNTGSSRRIYTPPEPNTLQIPIRVRRRGEDIETDMTLIVRRDQLGPLGAFFSDISRFGRDDD